MGNILAFTSDALESYRETLIWQSTGDDLQLNERDRVWSDEALAATQTDVTAFIEANWNDVKDLDAGQVGHDFCLTRNRHGAGFWDRGLGERGDRLTNACDAFGEQDPYAGDDGFLYV